MFMRVVPAQTPAAVQKSVAHGYAEAAALIKNLEGAAQSDGSNVTLPVVAISSLIAKLRERVVTPADAYFTPMDTHPVKKKAEPEFSPGRSLGPKYFPFRCLRHLRFGVGFSRTFRSGVHCEARCCIERRFVRQQGACDLWTASGMWRSSTAE
eukprot:UN1876